MDHIKKEKKKSENWIKFSHVPMCFKEKHLFT